MNILDLVKSVIRKILIFIGIHLETKVAPVEKVFGQQRKLSSAFFHSATLVSTASNKIHLFLQNTLEEWNIFIIDNTSPEVVFVDIGGGFLDHFFYFFWFIEF